VPAAASLQQTLAAAANSAGGWPYYARKSSRIEPTCWALAAIGGSWSGDAASWERFAAPHLQWLAGAQRRDGLLVDRPEAPANFTANGLAACVFAHMGIVPRDGGVAPDLGRLLEALVAARGVSVDAADSRQDTRLQGWPWMADTFSWLEPTSWCVLALKKAGARTRGAEGRIAEAETLIANRVCQGGGWNYGNASVIGQDLRPYVPTTALGLIALQNRPQLPAVERSLAWLNQARLKEPSAMALALTAICLRIHGAGSDEVDARLADDVDRATRIGNLLSLAMMLYALTGARHGAQALRV
jgi:hypothetical protein